MPKNNPFTAIERIEEFIESSIRCSKCSAEGQTTYVPDIAATHFFEEGWRVTINQNVYCPLCAKKHKIK